MPFEFVYICLISCSLDLEKNKFPKIENKMLHILQAKHKSVYRFTHKWLYFRLMKFTLYRDKMLNNLRVITLDFDRMECGADL